MNRAIVCVLLAGLSCVCSASSAAAQQLVPFEQYGPPPSDPRPRSGIAGVIVGSAASGIAALNLGTLPMCYASFYPDDARDACTVLSFAFAGIATVVAVPALSIGIVRRKKYKAWKARNFPKVTGSFAPAPLHGGAALMWSGRF